MNRVVVPATLSGFFANGLWMASEPGHLSLPPVTYVVFGFALYMRAGIAFMRGGLVGLVALWSATYVLQYLANLMNGLVFAEGDWDKPIVVFAVVTGLLWEFAVDLVWYVKHAIGEPGELQLFRGA